MARNLLSYKKKEQSLQSQSKESEKHQYGFKDRIDHFTWSWFACTMSTGAIAVLLANQPNKFPGLLTIGKIFFILDLVLLIGFSCMITLRFWRNPRKFTKSLHYPNEALFFGAFWVSIALVLNCIELYAVPVCGPWLVRALGVMFWMYAASALIIAIFQYVTLFVAERMPVASAMPAWVFPVYPFLVIGPLAGTLLASQPEGAALPILIGGIMFQGLGWTVACFMYTIYIVRLMSNELPSPPTRPGMFISVGPAGYTAAGLVSLGSYAPTVIPDGFLNMSTVSEGEVIKVIGVVSGIFIWLVAFWFCALSCVSVLAGARKMSFTLNWWAFIFPNGGLTLAAIQIGNQLRSPAIQGVCSALTLILVILWLFVAASHILAVTKRQILWEGQDEDHGMDV